MNYLTRSSLISSRPLVNQKGFSLIELMVAVVIGLFITLGLSQLFLSMYSTSTSQNMLSQYQDNQRTAIVMLMNTVQKAGYFYNPTVQAAVTALPALASANADTSVFTPGTGITGKGTGIGVTSTTSDTINIDFLSSGSDGVFNCQGGIAAAGTPTTFVNSFSINVNNQLQCTVTSIVAGIVNGPSAPLVLATGVQSMNILYGVDLLGSGAASSYLPANTVQTAGMWANVRTVQITLNFIDANVMNPATALTSTTPWTQTINLMRQS